MAPHHWKKLQGLFCVYKPNHKNMAAMKDTIITNLTNDLLAEPNDSPKENYVTIDGSLSEGNLQVNVTEKLSVHPLALGPLYRPEDFKLLPANNLHPYVSGVCVYGINNGKSFVYKMKKSNIIRTYRLTGLLGKATNDFYYTGKVVEKSTYTHVDVSDIEKVLMVIQAGHQRMAMEHLGCDIQSQEAYEILSKDGLVRPDNYESPLIYSLKTIDFRPPYFTVELNCINEYGDYLLRIIHEIGIMLKTNATTVKMRCIRYGPFNLDHSLVRKHWRLQNIIENIQLLRPIKQKLSFDSPHLKQLPDDDSHIVKC